MLVLKHFLDIRTIIWITSYIIGWMFYNILYYRLDVLYTIHLFSDFNKGSVGVQTKQLYNVISTTFTIFKICPVYEIEMSMSLKFPCLCNVHVSEMSMSLKWPLLWNVHFFEMSMFLKSPCYWNVHVSEVSCLWNVNVWNVQHLFCCHS